MFRFLFTTRTATAPTIVEIPPGKASLAAKHNRGYSRPDKKNEMHSNVCEHDSDINYSEFASMLWIRNKISEAHKEIEEQEVCTFVLRLFPKSSFRFKCPK